MAKKKGKRKISPALRAYSSCVKEMGLSPKKLSKKTSQGRSNIKKLKACANKKLRRK